jgi:hypothetical protein
MKVNPALQYVTDVYETRDIKEVAQMLASGDWIAMCATLDEPFLFALGKVSQVSLG